MMLKNKSGKKYGLSQGDLLFLWLGILLSLTIHVPKSSAQVVVADGFNITPFATIFQPSGLAFPPEGSLFGTELFVGGWGEAPPDNQLISDKIYRVSPDGGTILFATLLPEADPVSLKFSQTGTAFGDFLYVASNNRDNRISGDCGGTIQTVDLAGNVLDFTSLTAPFNCPFGISTALEEPGGIIFGRGDAFGSDLFVANFSERPADIVRVDSTGNTTPFVNDGKFSRRSDFGLSPLDVAFGPGGDFGTDLYFNDNGELCNCIRIADATGRFSQPFVSLPGVPLSLKFGPGGPFGNDLYVSVIASGGSSIFRVKADGSASLFANGFSGLLSVGALAFSSDGTAMYVADTSGNTVYRIDAGFTNVTVIDTISTLGIDLDLSSISPSPFRVTAENGQTRIEWRFDIFRIGQIEDLIFDVTLKNPSAGEDRLVSHKVELLYTDVNGSPIRIELPAKFVHVLSSAVSSVLSTDKSEYTANEDVFIDLSITNLSGFARIINAVIDIEDAQGHLVQTLTTFHMLFLAAGETKDFLPLAFNTGAIFDGDYRVHLRMIEAGVQIGEAITNFAVLPVRQADSSIVSDKMTYSSNESVKLISTLTGQNTNSPLTDLMATVTITDLNVLEIFTETRTLPDLLPEARFEFKSFTNTGTLPAGFYTANLKINTHGLPLTSAQTNFEILSSLDQATALSGTININPNSILETESTSISYTIQNTGNVVDLPEIMITILLVDPDTGAIVRTIVAETGLNGREVFADSLQWESTGLAPKSYLIVLQGTTAGITQTLDSGGLQIIAVPNTAPVANAGPDQSGLTNQTIFLNGTDSADPDGDPLTFDWHFVSVPQSSRLTDAKLTGATTASPEFIPDVEGIYTLNLVVRDGVFESAIDTISIFINPAPSVDIHPETINLKSNGGSKSVTGVLKSPVLSAFEFFTAADGVTVTSSFSLNNEYVDLNGETVLFTIPGDDYPGDDFVEAVDEDGDGTIDQYQLTLKFDRDLLIAGFKDENGVLRITDPTELTSTVMSDGLSIGSDINTVISPGKKK